MEEVNKIELKTLIAQNEIEEAINRLLAVASVRKDTNLYNTVVLLSNRWEQYEMKRVKVIASEDELNLLRNQIAQNLLDVIDGLDEKSTISPPRTPALISSAKRRLFLGVGAVVLLSIILYFIVNSLNFSGAEDDSLESRQREFQAEEIGENTPSFTTTDKLLYLPETQKVIFANEDRTTFEIVKSELKEGNDKHYLLYLTIRCATTQDINFWDSSFRLQSDELPGSLAPINTVNEVVKKNTYRDKEFVFDIPKSLHHFLLVISFYGQEHSILMLLETEDKIAREREIGVEALPAKKLIFPKQKEVIIPWSGYTATFKVAKDTIEYADATTLLLTLTIGCTTTYTPGINFWSDIFRLKTTESPGPIAPINGLNKIAEGNTYIEGDIVFEIPATTTKATLIVRQTEVERTIDLEIK